MAERRSTFRNRRFSMIIGQTAAYRMTTALIAAGQQQTANSRRMFMPRLTDSAVRSR
jgi:hypothetical protein